MHACAVEVDFEKQKTAGSRFCNNRCLISWCLVNYGEIEITSVGQKYIFGGLSMGKMYAAQGCVLRTSIVLGLVAAVVTIIYFTPLPGKLKQLSFCAISNFGLCCF